MILLNMPNKYPYQNTLEYKTKKRVGFQNNFKMRRHDESLGISRTMIYYTIVVLIPVIVRARAQIDEECVTTFIY